MALSKISFVGRIISVLSQSLCLCVEREREMASLTLTLPFFKLHDQPSLLLRCNNSSNQTLLRFNLSPPKPLLISSRDNSFRRLRALPETIAVKQDDTAADDDNPPATTVNTKLYFGNLPYNVDSATLAQIIQDFANPELVEVLYNRDTGQSRGFAFVTMSNVEDCNVIIENLDGTVSERSYKKVVKLYKT